MTDNDFYQTDSAKFTRENGEIVEANFFYVHHSHEITRINKKLDLLGLKAANTSDLGDFFNQHKISLLTSPHFQYHYITTTDIESIEKLEYLISTMDNPTEAILELKSRQLASKEIRALPAIMRKRGGEPIQSIKVIDSFFYDHDGTLIMAIKK